MCFCKTLYNKIYGKYLMWGRTNYYKDKTYMFSRQKRVKTNSLHVHVEFSRLTSYFPRFFVELDDTILFPEGGGQPDDRGKINEHEVKKVIRKADKVILLLSC